MKKNKKLFKEGAGAGYTVDISRLTIGEVVDIQKEGDYYSFSAKIEPGDYEIAAQDYYNDYFWEEHEFGDTPTAKIDGGLIHGTIDVWESTDGEEEEWVREQVEGTVVDLTFGYSWGWTHINLPEDGQINTDRIENVKPDPYFEITEIELDALDLAQAVNCGYASLDDRYND